MSSFGVFPKWGQPGNLRLIVDLLSPKASSVNDGIESAYRNVLVHPSDRYLLGIKWYNQYYVDLALPFGLRSAPFTFNSIADLLEWILLHSHHIPALLHYLPGHSFFHTAAYYGRLNVGYLAVFVSQPP